MRTEAKSVVLYHRVVVWLLFLILLLPLLGTLVYSLSTSWSATILPDGLTFKWYLALWSDSRFLAAFGQSLLVCFGALLLAINDEQGLRYAGRVGSGFGEAMLKDLHQKLRQLARDDSPLAVPLRGPDARGVSWVEPRLVAEVEFAEWTNEGIVRQATFVSLRSDKPAEAITREQAAPDRKSVV